MEHFGKGERIPRHKYGIYSRIWRKEREKVIMKNVVQKKRPSTNQQNSKRNNLPVHDQPQQRPISSPKRISRHNFLKKSTMLTERERDYMRINKLLNKVHKYMRFPLSQSKDTKEIQEQENRKYEVAVQGRNKRTKHPVMNQNKYPIVTDDVYKTVRHNALKWEGDNLRGSKTQGDRLVAIKANRRPTSIHHIRSFTEKPKPTKTRGRLSNVANAGTVLKIGENVRIAEKAVAGSYKRPVVSHLGTRRANYS